MHILGATVHLAFQLITIGRMDAIQCGENQRQNVKISFQRCVDVENRYFYWEMPWSKIWVINCPQRLLWHDESGHHMTRIDIDKRTMAFERSWTELSVHIYSIGNGNDSVIMSLRKIKNDPTFDKKGEICQVPRLPQKVQGTCPGRLESKNFVVLEPQELLLEYDEDVRSLFSSFPENAGLALKSPNQKGTWGSPRSLVKNHLNWVIKVSTETLSCQLLVVFISSWSDHWPQKILIQPTAESANPWKTSLPQWNPYVTSPIVILCRRLRCVWKPDSRRFLWLFFSWIKSATEETQICNTHWCNEVWSQIAF